MACTGFSVLRAAPTAGVCPDSNETAAAISSAAPNRVRSSRATGSRWLAYCVAVVMEVTVAIVPAFGQSNASPAPAGKATPAADRTANAASDSSTSAASRLPVEMQRRLDAGEYGAVWDAARRANGPDRSILLQNLSTAQAAWGDYSLARRTAGMISNPEERAAGLANSVAGAAGNGNGVNGGGSQPDFGPLIDLITQTIAPESWIEVGGTGTVEQFPTGVKADPKLFLDGILSTDKSGRLDAVRSLARPADLQSDLAAKCEWRVISLRRLESAVADRLSAGQRPTETMQYLGGLTAVRHLIVDREQGDLQLVGPAEGWQTLPDGRVVGRESGRPVLQLDDLVTLLRVFDSQGAGVFGCSINPREAQLAEMKSFAESSQSRGPLRPGQVDGWVRQLQAKLGRQDVVYDGVPPGSRVARVIVEADYRMKLIGIAKLDGGREIPSYFDLLKTFGQAKSGVPLEALRWWLTMNYESVLYNPEKTVFELRGSGVLVQSENQFVTAQGQRHSTGICEPVNRQFAENFTKHYAELAKRDPVFADLQNLFDLGMIAALCRQQGLWQAVKWDGGVFRRDGGYEPPPVEAVLEVETAAHHRVYNGRDIVVQVAGGVVTNHLAVLNRPEMMRAEAAMTALPPGGTHPPATLRRGRWWWNAGQPVQE